MEVVITGSPEVRTTDQPRSVTSKLSTPTPAGMVWDRAAGRGKVWLSMIGVCALGFINSSCSAPSNRGPLEPESVESPERAMPTPRGQAGRVNPIEEPPVDSPSSEDLMRQLVEDHRGADDALANMMERAETEQPSAERADPDTLGTLLPESYEGAERRSRRAFPKPSSSGPYRGHPASIAEAEYQIGATGQIRVRLTDLGSKAKPLVARQRAWKARVIPISTDLEFARIVEIEGIPAFEEFRATTRSSNIEAIVQERYLIEVRGRGVFSDVVRQLFQKIQLDGLTP